MYFVFKALFQALCLEMSPLKATLDALGENPRMIMTQNQKALDIFLHSGFKF